MFPTRIAAMLIVAPAIFAAAPVVRAQQNTPQPKPVVPAKVEIVISRYAGDKKTSSLPYTLMVNVNGQYTSGRTSLRMGVDVPIGQTTTTRDGVTTSAPTFKNIGTNIDCSATSRDDGRFEVYVNVIDSSIYVADGETSRMPRLADPAAFRTFSTSNTLTLRDGQTIQFTAAADKLSGEVTKIDVTFNVIK
jgi:hypothetical protein